MKELIAGIARLVAFRAEKPAPNWDLGMTIGERSQRREQ
jgi:hypothetical protein